MATVDLNPALDGAGLPISDSTMLADEYDRTLAQSPDWPAASSRMRWRQRAFRKPVRRMLIGFAVFFALWYVSTSLVAIPRFEFIPSPISVFLQWVSPNPAYGISLFTPIYYEDILVSSARVYAAFLLSVSLGAPLGILIGWSRKARDLIFPVLELLRPIPPLAWVPFAVLVLYGTELPVIFVTMLAAFFATILNTYLGVRSIDETYLRAAACLGYPRSLVLWRVIIPGALPFIFTGMEIAMGVAWFSLVGGEMIAGRSGLGYMIFDAYQQVALPNIFIGMITLGVLGWLSSAAIRRLGQFLMAWHNKDRGGQ